MGFERATEIASDDMKFLILSAVELSKYTKPPVFKPVDVKAGVKKYFGIQANSPAE